MIKAVLFDIGGVLVNLPRNAFVTGLSEILKPMPSSTIREIALGEQARMLLTEFESGAIDEKQYLSAFERLLDRPIPNKAYWTRVHTGPEQIRVDRQAVGVLRRIKSKCPDIKISAVSNVDQVRLKYCIDAIGFDFDHVVPSFRVRSCKPETFIYKAALAENGVLAAEAMFWDDRDENISAAADLGICAHRFTEVPAMERVLTDSGLL